MNLGLSIFRNNMLSSLPGPPSLPVTGLEGWAGDGPWSVRTGLITWPGISASQPGSWVDAVPHGTDRWQHMPHLGDFRAASAWVCLATCSASGWGLMTRMIQNSLDLGLWGLDLDWVRGSAPVWRKVRRVG